MEVKRERKILLFLKWELLYKNVTDLQLTGNYGLFYVDPFQPQMRNTRKMAFQIFFV